MNRGSGTIMRIALGLAFGALACTGPTGPEGKAGEAGKSCTSVLENGVLTVTCPDGTYTVKDGAKGDTGIRGATGPQGEMGNTGATGAVGATGPQGEIGATGPQGEIGATGPQGEIGATGADGAPGISTGTLTGILTYKPSTTAAAIAARGVVVGLVPTAGVTSALTDATGAYSFASVPVGVYTVKFSGKGFTAVNVANVTVLATQTTTVSQVLSGWKPDFANDNPIVAAGKVFTAPARFGTTAQIDVTVTAPVDSSTDGTGFTYAWTKGTANPTAVTLSSDTAKNPTFPMPTLAAVLASGKIIGVEGLEREGFVPVSAQQLAQMTYNFTCTITDVASGYAKSVSVAVPPATLAPGNATVPRNQIVIASLPGGSTTAPAFVKPSGSTATLSEGTSATPWFIPDVEGEYEVGKLKVYAGNFNGASSTCGTCHSATLKPVVEAKFNEWGNSAHGNHFFKYMEYVGIDGSTDAGFQAKTCAKNADCTSASGEVCNHSACEMLTWKKDASGNPLPAPTADATIFWKTADGQRAMTTFEFGMTGAEGSHYSRSCTGCHTTGYNLLAANGGADDAMDSHTDWTFPNLATVFGDVTATTAPNATAWAAMPGDVKKFAGMQCESCHGPLSGHLADADNHKPVAEFGAAACAVCHDKPAGHDRVALWRQSKHADLELALEESTVATRGTSTSCYRCHSAQGYLAYLGNKETNPDGITRPASLSQTGFTACMPTHGHRQALDPLDSACACKPGTSTDTDGCTDDGGCPTGDACEILDSATDGNGTCVAKCKPEGTYCEPVAGHRESSEVYDTACYCRPGVATAKPAMACTLDADCTTAGSICVGKICVYKGCKADNAFATYLVGLGLEESAVQSQTCAACHDAHSTELRVEGDTGKLGNATRMIGAGAGATCMVCHNTRNGARGDFVTVSSVGGPHAPVQTDLFLGANAYFMGAGGQVSAHAAVQDTCVGCHMKLHPDSITVRNTNHTFEADETICKSCHAASVNLEALNGQFMVNRGNLEAAFATAFSKIAALKTGTPAAIKYYVIAKNPVSGATPAAQKIELTQFPTSIVPSGRSVDLKMTFATPVSAFGSTTTTLNVNYQAISATDGANDWVYTVADANGNVLNTATVARPAKTLNANDLGTAVLSKTGIFAKANWNYWLVSSVTANPAANVVHNPSFVFDVLSATTGKLLGANGSGL